ncbi:predicted protein [Naegleria gruberi]|uniref:Predicted protein n=1 Tax=Naegleria gruberi TaxID=5762 RepID=D2VAI4_NAEGR|nr:uncharacterized protein NAEGRDRAFT_47970 [Naegleria gruberi]EFC46079.1 predicted protein [Naegleria gruberi]|eukprot:XP_002678823.1 predicted protein [Naegleria gruberi strain NEG-M]
MIIFFKKPLKVKLKKMSEIETPPRSHQNDVDELLNGIDESADEVLASVVDTSSSVQTTNIILEEGNNNIAHGDDLMMINGDLLSNVNDNSSSIVHNGDQTKSKQLSLEEIQLMKRQKEEVPFLMSSFPNVKTSFGYKSNFHTACPYTARVICYCTKFFQNSKQEQRYIHNTKSILEMYCKSRPEYANEFGFNRLNQPTLNSTIVISRDRLEGISNTYSDVIDSLSSNKPQQEMIDENDALIQLIDEFPQTEETIPSIESTVTAPVDVSDAPTVESVVETPKTETESQSSTKIFSETDLSQIPKKRGRPRTRKLCKICNSFEQETKFIQCLSCNSYFHTFCYTPNLEHLEQVHKDNWLCSDCKICLKCRKGPNEGTLVFCDYCDCGFHVDKCLTDSQKPEEGKKQWFCPNCLENHSEGIENFKTDITTTNKAVVEASSKASASEEKKTKTPKKKKKKK